MWRAALKASPPTAAAFQRVGRMNGPVSPLPADVDRRRAAYRPNPATAKTPRDSGDRRAVSQRAVGKEVANPSPWVCPSALALALAPLPLAPLPSWIRNALSLNRAVSD